MASCVRTDRVMCGSLLAGVVSIVLSIVAIVYARADLTGCEPYENALVVSWAGSNIAVLVAPLLLLPFQDATGWGVVVTLLSCVYACVAVGVLLAGPVAAGLVLHDCPSSPMSCALGAYVCTLGIAVANICDMYAPEKTETLDGPQISV
jgi:hypothetical protein